MLSPLPHDVARVCNAVLNSFVCIGMEPFRAFRMLTEPHAGT